MRGNTRITSFALSPRYLQVLLRAGIKPNKTHSLASLSAILSTGSSSNPDLYNYIQDCIGPVFINNVTGETNSIPSQLGFDV